MLLHPVCNDSNQRYWVTSSNMYVYNFLFVEYLPSFLPVRKKKKKRKRHCMQSVTFHVYTGYALLCFLHSAHCRFKLPKKKNNNTQTYKLESTLSTYSLYRLHMVVTCFERDDAVVCSLVKRCPVQGFTGACN